MVEETDTKKPSKFRVSKMVEREADVVEEPRGTPHGVSIRKGFLGRWCLHWVLNHWSSQCWEAGAGRETSTEAVRRKEA